MIIVDTALEQREREGKPVRVGLVGAGYMGRSIALQLVTCSTGMRLVAIANRTVAKAERSYQEAGAADVETVDSVHKLEKCITDRRFAVTADAAMLCRAANIDLVIEATGEIEAGARVALEAIRNGKHVVLANAELDATVGPILKKYADQHNVVITNIDGDEPGVAMNLFRFAKTLGYKPVLAGNLKGMIDPYRTPETQKAFAEKYNQNPRMMTSFADGTKLSMETTILANATGLRAGKRGMYGPKAAHVKETMNLFPKEQLLDGGLVDYVLGAEPHTGAFVVVYNDEPLKKWQMSYMKMGDGPFYCFYTPYHLPQMQFATTVARAALFRDATVAPLGAPVCEVLAAAKRDLKAGEVLDGIGGFTCYGVIDNAKTIRSQRLLPMGISQDCRLKRDIKRDEPIGYGDVELPPGRLCDQLHAEQDAMFAS